MPRPLVKNAAVLALGLGLAAPVLAQNMFRCGNAYQDRPCDSGQPAKVVGKAAPSPTVARPVLDADCSRRGAAAQKLVWQREAGVTEEASTAAAGTPPERRLVGDVYSRRGTAPEVRAAVEADCVVEKQRAAQAAVMLEALARQQEESGAAGQRAARPPVNDAPPPERVERKADAGQKEQQQQQRCAALVEELRQIQVQQRAGANAVTMERLNQQRRDAERARRDANCPV
ncbi:hypothetical protein [Ideonella sp. BN130291]|uniref:hypothetical protein n=1 Tax=Ideonella sp. BN130291 TaxID=3112940 RepID=UPI002E27129F|nr:hypothetical protein [Ideonella sp. BN130291]